MAVRAESTQFATGVGEFCDTAGLFVVQELLFPQPGHRRSEMRLGSVPEFHDERVTFERLLHDAALHALATAVNEPYFPQARLVRGVQIFLDHRRDIARQEGVQIQRWLYGYSMGHINCRRSRRNLRNRLPGRGGDYAAG